MIRFAACAAAALSIAACSSPPKPTTLDVSIVATDTLNPTIQKRPSPAVVRLFELRNAASFEAADYTGLFEKDKETLAADLVSRDEYVIKPGETKLITKTYDPALPPPKAIGIAVGYRALDRAAWRLTVPIRPNEKNTIVFSLDALAVTVRK